MKRWIQRIVVTIIVLGLIGGGAYWYWGGDNGKAVSYRTAEVKRDSLVVTISATGTVEPEEVVDVGAQVAGRIISFGKDKNGKAVDYGSAITAGTVLAEIDDSLYTADRDQAAAQLQLANAGLEEAEADLLQMKAKRDQAQKDWTRAQKLESSEALAQTSYDAYKAAYDVAQANVAVGEAACDKAEATIVQAEAVLKRVQRNLGYCTIASPVDGVIIDRRVNIGQTVVASLNAPSLFLIAKDLKRMQVWVAVNEADIGKIRPGLPVSFTVDAFSGETFRGEVGKVRLNASMTQNVVTYTVEVLTDNSAGRLLPYLTANVRFELQRHDDVLLVPNAALRWTPSVEQVAPEYREAFQNPAAQKRVDGAPRPASGPTSRPRSRPASRSATTAGGGGPGVVWVLAGQFVRPVPVRVGISDGVNTEVQGKDLTEGMEVVIGQQAQSAGSTDTSNPFVPKFPRRGGSRPSGGSSGGSGNTGAQNPGPPPPP